MKEPHYLRRGTLMIEEEFFVFCRFFSNVPHDPKTRWLSRKIIDSLISSPNLSVFYVSLSVYKVLQGLTEFFNNFEHIVIRITFVLAWLLCPWCKISKSKSTGPNLRVVTRKQTNTHSWEQQLHPRWHQNNYNDDNKSLW